MKTAKITGGAGTQKTSHLIRQIEKDLQSHFIKDIGAVSLTKAAVKTIKNRLWHLGIKNEDVKGCGTIHSLAYSLIGKRDIADTPANMKKFISENPKFSIELNDENDNKGLFSEMQYNRNKMISIEKWKPQTQKFFYTWQSFCNNHNMTDFTGILENALQSPVNPDFKILYVDETQDQTPLATSLIMKWAQNCEKVSFYGDDDQSLYRFSGAIPEAFIEMPADFFHNRPQSFRCPVNILNYAMKIIRKCKKRIEKEYAPLSPELLEKQNIWREKSGKATYDYTEGIIYPERDLPDLSLPGSHMILCRANYQTEKWRHWLLEKHIPFSNPYREDDKTLNPCNTKIWRAVGTYQRLIGGNEVLAADMKELISLTKASEVFTKRGAKSVFEKKAFSEKVEQFGLISENFNEKFLFPEKDVKIEDFIKFEGISGDLAKWHFTHAPGNLLNPPAVIIGTVHSVKGGESENVWFDVGSTPAIQRSILENDKTAWDDECRVAYVAVTRARRCFGLLTNKMKNLVF